eukprot:CAMPEP_0206214594 /NCGR_PEP_ID=MMETSP0047_2-20121206/1752_1 /ASSEMBLY_ACC=CAM_ASM_000192 /TAXON_ID=195065 /ORGANISM="Chroomonas mesostigmatica_cf, Strain CCMP1168" /LENGTH=144 /DNA_ID=CAMNT_0053636847 /DNA_START=717 /DNA_END=1149 /DNA_ORIENTATION=+
MQPQEAHIASKLCAAPVHKQLPLFIPQQHPVFIVLDPPPAPSLCVGDRRAVLPEELLQALLELSVASWYMALVEGVGASASASACPPAHRLVMRGRGHVWLHFLHDGNRWRPLQPRIQQRVIRDVRRALNSQNRARSDLICVLL